MSQERITLDVPLVEAGTETFRGRLIGEMLTSDHGLVACIRVPRNGLWGRRPFYEEDDPTLHEPDGIDDRWVAIEGNTAEPLCRPAERSRLGAWVEARPRPHSSYLPGSFELVELPPRRVRLEWQPLPVDNYTRQTDPYMKCTYRLAFPDDPDLESWADTVFASQYQGGPHISGWHGWGIGWACSCGELGCGSILLEVQPAAEEGWVELREISCGHEDGWDLMPWLLVRADAPVRPFPA